MNKKKLAILLCLGLLIAAIAVNGTISYLTDSDEKLNVFKVGDIDVELEEDEWEDDDENELRYPGDIKYKNPTVKAVKGDIYFRIMVELVKDDVDNPGEFLPVSDAAAALIWNTIYYDVPETLVEGQPAGDVTALSGIPHYNPAFVETPASGEDSVKYYTYTAAGAPAVLAQGDSAVLFTTIAIPSNYGNDDFKEMGDYNIRITVEAIQAANIVAADAAAALDDAY